MIHARAASLIRIHLLGSPEVNSRCLTLNNGFSLSKDLRFIASVICGVDVIVKPGTFGWSY
jgi:hypothetical protein